MGAVIVDVSDGDVSSDSVTCVSVELDSVYVVGVEDVDEVEGVEVAGGGGCGCWGSGGFADEVGEAGAESVYYVGECE